MHPTKIADFGDTSNEVLLVFVLVTGPLAKPNTLKTSHRGQNAIGRP